METIKLLIVMMIVAMPAFSQSGMPSITVTEAEKDFTLPIKRAKVDVKIVGSLAITTYDIHFFNPNNRTLEGQLDFPLADGVIVSRFAMDVNEKLREGVIVKKDKGRVTYEKIVNRRVDPGLLEVTRGNNFRSRVYPLFANKEKHIVIAYEEELKVTPDGLKYSLPLDMPNELDSFSFRATVYSDFAEPINNSSDNSDFRKADGAYTLMSEYTDYEAKEIYEFIIPNFGEQSLQLETYNNEDFFRISINPEMMLRPKAKPQTISVLWDISASRLNSDIEKDLELLEEYLDYNQCNVELVPFSIYADAPMYFEKPDFDEIEANINGLRIDGATNYSSVDISKLRGEEIFIFSDGINNMGEGSLDETEKPMYVINSSSISDHDVCRNLARKTGGEYINLLAEHTDRAMDLLCNEFPYFMGIDGAASEVYPQKAVVKGTINIAGKVSGTTQLKLKFGFKNQVTKTIPINLTESNRTNSGMLHKIWAKQKLEMLNLDQTSNEKEITDLAKKYSLVTAFTSLIVLETARDYYIYNIEPPAELREEYDTLVNRYTTYYKQSKLSFNQSRYNQERIKQQVQSTVNELKRWYDFNFEEKKYLDSCLTFFSNNIEKMIGELGSKSDSELYYTINLKRLFPEFNFEKYRLLNYYILNNVDESWSNRDFIPHNSTLININKDIKIHINDEYYNYNLSKVTNIRSGMFKTEPVMESEVRDIEFIFNIGFEYCEGLNEVYATQDYIALQKSELKIKIRPEDTDDFYYKIFIFKDLSNYISTKNLDEVDNWKHYAELVNQVVQKKLDDMKSTPSNSFYDVIDLDSLLPEYKEYNHQHFKYLDVSREQIFWNYSNDSLYRASKSDNEFYIDDDVPFHIDSNSYILYNEDHYSSGCLSDYFYNIEPIRVHKSYIKSDYLYLITSWDYYKNIDDLREEFHGQVKNVNNRVAIPIFDETKKLDFSKLHIFKNIAIAKDKNNYLSNIKKQYHYERKETAKRNLFFYAGCHFLNERKSGKMNIYPINKIDSAANILLNKKIRIFWQNPSNRRNNIMDVDRITLFGNSKSKSFSYNEILDTNSYISKFIGYASFSDQFLSLNKMTSLDSIKIDFKYKVPGNQFEFDGSNVSNFDKKYFGKSDSYTIPIYNLKSAYDSVYVLNNPILFEKQVETTLSDFSKSELRGFVVDEEYKPLAGATVRIMGTKKGAKVRPDGSFIVRNIIPKTYDIRVTHITKAEQLKKNVKLDSNKIHQLFVLMEPRSSEISKVCVMANRAISDFSIRAARGNDTQILVEGMDYSNRFNGGMGIGGSKYFPDSEEPSANAFVTSAEYQSSKEYYKTLSSVALGELEDTYFELREDNQMNPSFFFDAAKVFEKNGKIKEACRVISNLAEINLEDHENLRRVAGFMMEHKEYTFAKSIYQHILKIRNEEPQSFRDYALCLSKLGEYQAAADSLYNLFTSDIAWEFSGIRSTLITEFNTLLDEHKDEIDISKYEPEYIFKTPVDMRIEITWAMDETDVDLWVIEPDSTKCYYSHRYTKNGGFISEDMRRGYGPEVYMIKKATPGKYKIRANYYSNRRQKSSIDPQVRCKIYTNYGRPNQQMQENIVKIEVDRGEIDLGEVVIE